MGLYLHLSLWQYLDLRSLGVFFNEKLRLEYLKRKQKKVCICHQPVFEQWTTEVDSGSCKRPNTEHGEEEAL